MNQYDTNVKIVLDYLSDNSKSQSLYSLSHSCFAQFRKYLEENNLDYSSKITSQWLELPSPRSTKTQKVYKKALARLDDVYQSGHIRFANRLRQSLSSGFLQIISEYLQEKMKKKTCSAEHQNKTQTIIHDSSLHGDCPDNSQYTEDQ